MFRLSRLLRQRPVALLLCSSSALLSPHRLVPTASSDSAEGSVELSKHCAPQPVQCAPLVTPEEVRKWTVEDVAERASREWQLDPQSLHIIIDQRISGKTLLGLTKADMKDVGLPLGTIDTLQTFINDVLGTGEKTVQIETRQEAITVTFSCADDLATFLRDCGAAGLRKPWQGRKLIRANHYHLLEDGETYMLDGAAPLNVIHYVKHAR